MKFLRFLVVSIFIFSLLATPTFAQNQSITFRGTCADGIDNNVNGLADNMDPSCTTNRGFCEVMTPACQTQINALASQATRNRFNPNVSIGNQGSNNVGGVSFSGVGGAVFSCANAGKYAMKGINAIKKSLGLGSIVGRTVPVNDEKAKAELQTLNNVQQCLDGVAYAAAKSLLQQVTNKTLNWVNSGFNGNPLYVRDQDSYLRSIRDEKIESYLEEVPAGNAIFGNVLRSALTNQITGINGPVNTQQPNTPQAKAHEEFMSDFTLGGWNAWLNTSQNDNNNPIGAFFNVVDTVTERANIAQQNTRDELNRNGGFLDLKRCVEWENQGRTTGGLSGEPQCARWETTTPGSTIARQVDTVLGSHTRQLEAADEINEVMGAYFDKLLNSLFSNGLGSIRGKTAADLAFNGGPGSNVVIGTNGLAINNSGSGFSTAATASGFSSGDFDISRPQHLRSIVQAQYNYLNRAKDTYMIINRIVPRLGELDYCLPGPNPAWANGAQENAGTFYSYFENKIANLPTGPLGIQFSVTTMNTSGLKLLDKTNGTDRPINRTYPVGTASFTGSSSGMSKQAFLDSLSQAFDVLSADLQSTFATDAIVNQFAATGATAGDQAYLRSVFRSAYKRAANLVPYSEGFTRTSFEYDTAISDTEDNIAQLEQIRNEVNTIVAAAKARYIAEQQAAGTPVVMSCINNAYSIDTTPITPVARQESDTPHPDVLRSNNARSIFYGSL